MKHFTLRRWAGRTLAGALALLAAGCIRVPDGPHAKVTLPCLTGTCNSVTPPQPCVTVAASRASHCEAGVSIDCGEAGGKSASLRPGQQATLCCPGGGRITAITTSCKGGEGECGYYIVTHERDAPRRRKFYW